MEVTRMSDEIKETVAVEETAAPAASAEPTMAEVFHDPNAPIQSGRASGRDRVVS